MCAALSSATVLFASVIALLLSTSAYAEPFQSNAQFRANWNNLIDAARANPSQVTHKQIAATESDPTTDLWTFPLPDRNVTVMLFENSRWAMYCFNTGTPTIDCYNNVGEKNVLNNNRATPKSTSPSGDFNCNSPILTVGKQDPSAVASLKLRHAGGLWSIVYTMSDGTVYQRNEQYEISDTSTANVQEWTGRKRTDSNVVEIGDLTQNGSTFVYNERLWQGGRLIIDATASCRSASQTVEGDASPSPPLAAVDRSLPGSGKTSSSTLPDENMDDPIRVPLQLRGGTFVVPVTINDRIDLDFTVDSGASTVVIPADVFFTLIRTGTIRAVSDQSVSYPQALK